MAIEDIVVLTCREVEQGKLDVKVMTAADAIKMLSKEQLWLEIDIAQGSCSVENKEAHTHPDYRHCQFKIGKSISCCTLEGYTLGVYDRTNINHIQDMVNSAVAFEEYRHTGEGLNVDE